MAQDRARRSDARSFIQTSLLKSHPSMSAGAFPFFFIVFDCSIFKKSGDTQNFLSEFFCGNVCIGTTVPGEKLEVEGNIKVSGTGMWHHGK